jgi:D-alanyl-D-alanine carboxypeptidase
MMKIKTEDLLGHFEPSTHDSFKKIHDGLSVGSEHFLRMEAAQAWEKMRVAALPDGILLEVVSSTRNFDRQKTIWENKWNGKSLVDGINLNSTSLSSTEKAKKIMRFSAMPGTSRHHWGTEIDLNSLEDEYFQEGQGKQIYLWLKVNASRFGFAQPYTEKNQERSIGYEEEKWHWSFTPLSRHFLKCYLIQVDYSDITGFEGSECAEELKVISTFVNGISGACR